MSIICQITSYAFEIDELILIEKWEAEYTCWYRHQRHGHTCCMLQIMPRVSEPLQLLKSVEIKLFNLWFFYFPLLKEHVVFEQFDKIKFYN